jgi:hypothetical protein
VRRRSRGGHRDERDQQLPGIGDERDDHALTPSRRRGVG